MASVDNTAKKPSALRTGTLWYTDDATQVSGLLIPTETNHSYHVVLNVLATEIEDFDEVGSYQRIATFKNDGGTLSIVGSVTSVHTAENTAGWDVTLDASGTNIRIRITGAAATKIAWQIDAYILEGGKTASQNSDNTWQMGPVNG
jgi:hypothetical protein